jgi:hypothetical protein
LMAIHFAKEYAKSVPKGLNRPNQRKPCTCACGCCR